MKKKILCLAMMVMVTMGATMTVNAEPYQGKDGWLVEFDGDQMNSNFNSSDLADETVGIQLGDSIELKVGIKNSGSSETDWYMTNEVIQTLEEAQAEATGGAYVYRLTYINGSGEQTVLYDSETVGGEGENQGGEGLHQATNSLEDYFYLDRLSEGQTGSVHLYIEVEGETQGNAYQQTLAKLQMNFAVEKVTKNSTKTEVVTNTKVVNSNTTSTVKTVKTGDTNRLLIFSALALVSGIILLILGARALKKRKDTDGKGERK